VLVRWCLQRDLVVLPKSTDRERLEENAQVFDHADRRGHGGAGRARHDRRLGPRASASGGDQAVRAGLDSRSVRKVIE
jgi:hypothetical protein